MESDSDSLRLPEGLYPFADQRLPLADMAMMEAPRELEDLLRDAAAAEGITIIRDRPVELRCKSAGYPDAVFLVFWPSGAERLNFLAPRSASVGAPRSQPMDARWFGPGRSSRGDLRLYRR